MKKGLCFLLSLVLALSCCSVSLASSDEIDLDTVTGAVEYPWVGFRFDPPELYRNTEKGIVIMLGPRDLSEIVDFVPCLYYAMTPERYAEYKGSHELTIPPEELWTDTLFEVYICRKGMTLRQYCTYSGGFMTDEELEQYYQELNGSRDLFDYLVYDVKAAVAEGEEAASESAQLEAKAIAEAISMAYQDGDDIEDITERFEAAVDSQTGETGEEHPSARTGVAGSSLSADYSEWLMGSRKAGDVTVVPDSDGSGSSVLVFLSRNDNHYNTVNVRHILIRAAMDDEGNYTDEAKAAAKARAEEILAEFEAGDKTEESFAALAEQYSEDSGSNTNGGLYENVPMGQMVPEFEAFCFAPHKSGDTGIVYGESSGYAGYHVMYYVGEGKLYSSVIADNALRSSDTGAWMDDLMLPYPVSETYWTRLVG